MVILLAGASGLLGTALRSSLRNRHVRRLVRTPSPRDKGEEVLVWDARTPPSPHVFDDVTAVINLSGAGIGDRRWSHERLGIIRGSRIDSTEALAIGLSRISRPIRFIQASAVGIYGDTGERLTTEESCPGRTPLANICVEWEEAAQPAIETGHPTALIRTGIVLTNQGGALAPLIRLIRLGVAGPLGSGRQWWPWIHIADWIDAVLFLLDSAHEGALNLTAPTPVRNTEFIQTLARAHNRPAILPVPRPALQVALGGFAHELLRSQRVVPDKLLSSGFSFRYRKLSEAAHELTSLTNQSS